MKKLLFIGVLLAMACGMQAQTTTDTFKVSDFELNAGEEKTIEIDLVNSERLYSAFQFFMTLPEGLSLVQQKITVIEEDEETGDEVEVEKEVYGILSSRAKASHSLNSSFDKGVYKFVVFSGGGENLSKKEGTMLTIIIKAADDLKSGELTAKIFDQTLTTKDAQQYTPADVTFKITATTGINEISAEKPATVYDLKGNQIRKNATSVEGLSKGVYIINNKKVIVK